MLLHRPFRLVWKDSWKEKTKMANHKQALKRHKQSLVRRARNQHFKSMMRTYLKRARIAIEGAVQTLMKQFAKP